MQVIKELIGYAESERKLQELFITLGLFILMILLTIIAVLVN